MKPKGTIPKLIEGLVNLGAAAWKQFSTNVPKAIKAFTKWLGAHPKTTTVLATAGIANMTTDALADLVESSAKEMGPEKAKEVRKEFEQWTTKLNPFVNLNVTDLIRGFGKTIDKLANHPDDWFPNDMKISGFDYLNEGLGDTSYLERYVIRNLYAAHEYTDDSAFFIPTAIKDLIYDAYSTFYARLSATPPKSKDQVAKDIGEILFTSFNTVGLLFSLKRYLDCKEVTFNGNAAVARAFRGVSPYENYTNAQPGGVALNLKAPFTGFKLSSPVLGSAVLVSYTPAQVTSFPTRDVGYDLTISNKRWTEIISQVKELSLSDNAYNICKYLYSQIWVDNARDADIAEVFVLHPCSDPIISDKAGIGQYDTDTDGMTGSLFPKRKYNDALASIQAGFERVTTLRNSDKAYVTMLAMLGLMEKSYSASGQGNKSPKWYDFVNDDLKRDQMSKTLHWQATDDSFYDMLYNSTFVATQALNADGKIELDKLVVMRPVDSDKYIYIGKPAEFKGGGVVNNLLPNPTTLQAGNVAVATKFKKTMYWMLGPIVTIRSASGVRVTSPAMTNLAVDGSVNSTGQIAYGPIANNIYQYYDNISTVPGNQTNCWWRTVTNNPATNLDDAYSIEYRPASNTNRFLVRDLDTVVDYQWINLFFGVSALKDIQSIFNTMQLYWAINS